METATESKFKAYCKDRFKMDDLPKMIGRTGISLKRFNDIYEGESPSSTEMLLICDVFDVDADVIF